MENNLRKGASVALKCQTNFIYHLMSGCFGFDWWEKKAKIFEWFEKRGSKSGMNPFLFSKISVKNNILFDAVNFFTVETCTSDFV